MCLSNQTYDRLKWLALVFMPALSVLVKGLGEAYGFVGTDLAVVTLNLLAVFLGSLLQLSSEDYHKGGGGYGYRPASA
ncbi:phage holin [Aerococcus loyolae]|uniref:Phage holin n=1 Tax=Aerococcus loyolae TaxID=2976809 RepID=A0ABT4BXB8_9LACT|nr:phage holin [Aerococcus loyolae]MCY3024912.1 phage holin [Aerococcus loyolae]MCY3027033.1 phage holin [Aerococcus loyolae]MCY3028616.1 phage holin [Aerococcus loyolae]OAM70568.1 holin [Aerococcus loyolae]